MDLNEAIDRLDLDIGKKEAAFDTLTHRQRLAGEELSELKAARKALADLARRYGEDVGPAEHATTATTPTGWEALTRLEAVERLLSEEARPMRLEEMSASLAEKGRPGDTVALVSSSLSHIKRKRPGVVDQVARGSWRFVPPEERTVDAVPPRHDEAGSAVLMTPPETGTSGTGAFTSLGLPSFLAGEVA